MRSSLLLPLIFGFALTASAAPELTGVMVTSERTAVTLADSATHQQSGWLQVGDAFEGYNLQSYDAKKGLLVLANGGGPLKLHLKQVSIPAAQLQLQGTIRLIDGRRVNVDQVSLTAGEISTFPLGGGVTCDITPTDQGDGTILYKLKLQKTETDGSITIYGSPQVVAPRGKSFSVRAGKMEIEFHDRS